MKPPVLIFVQSKERGQDLFHELIYENVNVDVIHSDRAQAQVFYLIQFIIIIITYIPSVYEETIPSIQK